MKINGTGAVGYVAPHTEGGRQAPAQQGTEPTGDRVTLSSGAEFMQQLKTDAQPPGGIREDVVSDMRAQIANGTFESGVNMDQMLDSLLSDL